MDAIVYRPVQDSPSSPGAPFAVNGVNSIQPTHPRLWNLPRYARNVWCILKSQIDGEIELGWGTRARRSDRAFVVVEENTIARATILHCVLFNPR